jgi:predicted nucleic acid-binding protein
VTTDRVALDTGPLSLHFGNDTRVRELMNDILKGKIEAHTCELNIAELFYKTCEKSGRETASVVSNSVRGIPIKIHSPDESLTLEAGSLKCTHRGKISLADSYILAVAKLERCRLVTTDQVLKEIGIVKTTFLKIS